MSVVRRSLGPLLMERYLRKMREDPIKWGRYFARIFLHEKGISTLPERMARDMLLYHPLYWFPTAENMAKEYEEEFGEVLERERNGSQKEEMEIT